MTYRKQATHIEREARWTVRKFLPLTILTLAILAAIAFGLHSAGLIGRTIVERKVFEHSYQRSEALKAEIATNQATITEIQHKLNNPNLDQDTRYNLEAQLSAARLRIATAKEKQQ